MYELLCILLMFSKLEFAKHYYGINFMQSVD